MCGLIFTNLKVNPVVFSNALNTIEHRGPDIKSGPIYINNFVAGHCRLSIVGDTVAGKQPMVDNTLNLAIVFNGEIYNYKELARDYGIQLKSGTDTELILRLYGLLGKDIVNKLNGMFAFVIINIINGQVFIARDRLGAKPLFVWKKKDRFVYASEILPILELIGASEPDETALRLYRCMRTITGGRTFYKDISVFPAGSWSDGSNITKYWSLEQKSDIPPSLDEIRELIKDCVQSRMIADVEIGGFLSGGLDSTTVILLSNVKKTWSVGFKDDIDLYYASMLAEKKSLFHSELVVDPKHFIEAAQKMISNRKLPLSVPNEVLIYIMALDVKRNGVKCVLAGEGADELFAGYDRIFSWAWNSKKFNIMQFAEYYCYGKIDIEVVEEALRPFMHYRSPYLITSAFFQMEHLGSLLYRLDQATMLAGVEAREPFADYRLVERMFGIPFSWKLSDLGTKTPLKKAFMDILPEEIINRQKIGFPVPLPNLFSSKNNKNGYDDWVNFNLYQLGWYS